MEPLHAAPEPASFVPIAEHQSRTPTSFHSGPPILHYHGARCKVVILEGDLLTIPALNALRGESATQNGAQEANGDEEAQDTEVAIDGVDTWVTSDKFLLYSSTASAGVSIPYPSISLHALQRLRVPGSSDEVQGLYMQIAIPSVPSEDDEEQSITLTVVPPANADGAEAEEKAGDESEESQAQKFYDAVSACSNLHPDPVEPGDEDEDEDEMPQFYSANGAGNAFFQIGGEGNGDDASLPPPVDGSSGWITADNMHEFFDEEGNWIAEGQAPSFPSLPLGPGAGNVRAREENGGDVDGEEEDETKWRRTD